VHPSTFDDRRLVMFLSADVVGSTAFKASTVGEHGQALWLEAFETLFRELPLAFLRMIVVHELAHLKERQHDKAFYQLCCRMEPDYHQLEFDVRAWLSWEEALGQRLWVPEGTAPPASG